MAQMVEAFCKENCRFYALTIEIIPLSNSTSIWDWTGLASPPLDLQMDSLPTALYVSIIDTPMVGIRYIICYNNNV